MTVHPPLQLGGSLLNVRPLWWVPRRLAFIRCEARMGAVPIAKRHEKAMPNSAMMIGVLVICIAGAASASSRAESKSLGIHQDNAELRVRAGAAKLTGGSQDRMFRADDRS